MEARLEGSGANSTHHASLKPLESVGAFRQSQQGQERGIILLAMMRWNTQLSTHMACHIVALADFFIGKSSCLEGYKLHRTAWKNYVLLGVRGAREATKYSYWTLLSLFGSVVVTRLYRR